MQPNDEDGKKVRAEHNAAANTKKRAPEIKSAPELQAILNRKRHRKNNTTPPPELGQNLNA